MKKLKVITIIWVILGTILIAEMVIIGAQHEFNGFWTNVYVAGIGLAVTMLVENRIRRYIDTKSRLERLILEMGSRDNAIAILAVAELTRLRFLKSGALKGGYFVSANLQHAQLEKAVLNEANFSVANLENAVCPHANFQGAFLLFANLKNADLSEANLEKTDFTEADLDGTDFTGAKLNGAIFTTGLTTKTVLPDGLRWRPGTDMRKFTDPS